MPKENSKNKSKRFLGDMPHSLEAEQALLGCLLLDQKVQLDVAGNLDSEDFYAESHKNIFRAMDGLIKANRPVDLVTLTDALEKAGELENAGGISYLAELTNVMPSTANYRHYLDIVTRNSMLRRLIAGSAEIIDNCKNSTDKFESLAFAEKTVFDISNTADTSTMARIDSVIPEVMAHLDEISHDKSKSHGIRTKFTGLDKILNGLHNSDLIILAARPAVGKTTFAMNIISNVALQGYSCAVFSLEMSKEQLVQRMLCSVSGVSMSKVSRGELDKTDWLKIAKAKELLSDKKVFIDDSAMVTPHELISKCRRLKKKFGLDVVMVDYIQLMNSGSKKTEENRQQEISTISRNLKILAKEINVPVIALSQLSRAVESRKGRPQLADLRESGAIEQDADIVMFIHRPDKNATEKEIAEGKVKQNVAEIIVEKHRNGEQGIVELYFNGECTKFMNLTKDGEIVSDGEIDGVPKNNGDKGDEEKLSEISYSPIPSPIEPDSEPEAVDFNDVDKSVF